MFHQRFIVDETILRKFLFFTKRTSCCGNIQIAQEIIQVGTLKISKVEQVRSVRLIWEFIDGQEGRGEGCLVGYISRSVRVFCEWLLGLKRGGSRG